MSKSATIGDRIKVLRQEMDNISVRALEKGGLPGDEWVVSNGLLSKWEDEPVEKATDKIEEFLNFYKINRKWWKTGQGPVFIASSNEKHTHDKNLMPIPEKTLGEMEAFRRLVEGGTEYLLIPRTAFEGAYRFVPVEQIAQQTKELEIKEQELARKDNQIQSLTNAVTDVIKQMISGHIPELPKIEEAKKNTAV